jgi:hypothetical protein
VYLYFLERSQSSLSLSQYVFLLIRYRVQSAKFCKIVVSPSEAVFRILPLVCCVPTFITLSLFIGLDHTSNDWKVKEVKYKFGITSLLR